MQMKPRQKRAHIKIQMIFFKIIIANSKILITFVHY